ncbi:GspE/PulE family protein [Bacillus smithii]|uniref:GspE/PulE family protein n=1 Tax=Bacillus smithii TaxID=1479 RepID=UPI002E21813E|nr:ATPase, T2SS/T4P/T4SS family [Bacillus smithii]MED1456081.1 ATPase, T2SS/T4P/T4SS family [Bacillus smithii]MED1489809.1 ATPase, T2SS/T4P/T4SS family [Bacillus smithii]
MERKRLGDLLVEAGVITEDQLQEALKKKKNRQKLGDVLVSLGYLNEQQLIEVLEFQLGIPHVKLPSIPIDTTLLKFIPKEFALKNLVFPIEKKDRELTVAMYDPLDFYTIDDLTLSTGLQIRTVIATREDIISSIYKYYNGKDQLNETAAASTNVSEAAEESVVALVNDILEAGIQLKASDIHIDVQESKLIVRFRIDGLLRTERILSKSVHSSLIARMKILGNMDITENRLPQDGRMKLSKYKTIDMRISILPTIYGEKVVIRLLDLQNIRKDISEVGFNKVNLQRFQKLIEKPSGLVIITGPTGSGKTSTLYAALNHLNTEEVNIVTIEDPVEYELEGINQVQVNPSIGLDFSTGLRAILRQDPNIIMVGEMRDKETVEIAIRSALTGHLVFSTMHTNSSIATIPRLNDMGVESYLVVSALQGVLSQRLVRKICPDCREAYEPSEMEKELFQKRGLQIDKLFYGKGCIHCRQTGYKGRLAIHELFILDEEIRQLLYNQKSMQEVEKACLKKGMLFLLDDGLLKAKSGLTTVREVLQATMS